jgi:hypothetical protein
MVQSSFRTCVSDGIALTHSLDGFAPTACMTSTMFGRAAVMTPSQTMPINRSDKNTTQSNRLTYPNISEHVHTTIVSHSFLAWHPMSFDINLFRLGRHLHLTQRPSASTRRESYRRMCPPGKRFISAGHVGL